jgi:hypothetical protein
VSLRWLALVAALGGTVAARPLRAQQPSRDWSPEDRVVLGDFSQITSIAAALDRVYVTSFSSLAIWRPLTHQWDPPVTPPPGVDLHSVIAALVDPLDNSLWLATPNGWIHYQAELRLWDQGSVGGGVRGLAFDQTAPGVGVYLRTGQGWLLVPRGSSTAMPTAAPARPVEPTTVADALQANPALQAFAPRTLLGPELRSARYTAAALAPDRQGWFLGTSGVGLLYLPIGSAFPQPMPFGIAGERIGAVLAVPGGVWAASDRTVATGAALTYIADDLSRFTIVRGSQTFGMPFGRTVRLAGQDSLLWAATESGVARINPSDPERADVDLIDEGRGLPDPRVYSLASYRGQMTVGTEHGIARINDSLRARRIAPRFADEALALLVSGDSLFVGTPLGVFVTLGDTMSLTRLPGLGESATFRVPVLRLAWLRDTLVALTRDRLYWRNPSGDWTLGPDLSGTLGGLRELVADGDGFWVAGDNGVGYVRLGTPPLRPLFFGDIPGPITGLAADQDYLWVGTTNGLARFRLDAIRP